MKNTIIQIKDLNKDEYVEIHKKNKNKRPRFRAVGDKFMDGIKILTEMTAHESYVINLIKENMDYVSNIAEVSVTSMTKTEQNKFSKGFKRLEIKDLVKRIRRGKPSIYMVNPDLIMPKDYEEAKVKWKDIR